MSKSILSTKNHKNIQILGINTNWVKIIIFLRYLDTNLVTIKVYPII
jgi:hypothetical protein